MEPETETLTETQAPPPRVCEHPDCDRELGPLNRSGRCGKHFHWKRTAKARSSPGVRQVAAGSNGANGHAPEPERVSGSTAGTEARSVEIFAPRPTVIREDRVDRLLVSLPLAEKTRIVQAWLSGEL
jgi:hypothetical protein